MKDYSHSNCKISNPILKPDHEILHFNGFAWSNQGIIHQINGDKDQDWQQWLGTQQ